MISRLTPSFRRALQGLSAAEQQAARKAFRQFMADPSHHSLRFKKLAGHENLWSARVTLSVRAVGHREGRDHVALDRLAQRIRQPLRLTREGRS